ncbi:bifunctional phosphoribosylaminoimidazolecarboxamide formyltransferase/IMP cyclohydrolase [Escherichia coli]|uniref:Bifunctional phosphoribosylaminoimidazolecarboxamide formyltransferase/IMP cyclohydrolase n=1 Tax=Escherichia coli TaxID=562 RepID=A0A2X1KVY2_ECOLX|nr:bifunctional phosphoribosylaminoimidazolecarboxamide formyltransferase/IMP cyclohydrolase [Escherichia coli]
MIANYFGSMVPAYHGESKEAAGPLPTHAEPELH